MSVSSNSQVPFVVLRLGGSWGVCEGEEVDDSGSRRFSHRTLSTELEKENAEFAIPSWEGSEALAFLLKRWGFSSVFAIYSQKTEVIIGTE